MVESIELAENSKGVRKVVLSALVLFAKLPFKMAVMADEGLIKEIY